MIPTDFTVYTKEKDGIVKGKLAWDKKTKERAEAWALGEREWDSKTNAYRPHPPVVKHRHNNMVPFNEIKIVGHGFDKKRSWLEIETPDGIQFQMNTGDLLQLVNEVGAQTEGILKGDFVWVVADKIPAVVCRSTKRYQEILTDAQKKKMRDSFPMRSLEVGGVYRTQAQSSGVEIYCGKYTFIVKKNGVVNGKWTEQHVIKLQHVFLSLYGIDSTKSIDAEVDRHLSVLKSGPNDVNLDFCSTKVLRILLTIRPIDANSLVLKHKRYQVDEALKRDAANKNRPGSGWGAYFPDECLNYHRYMGGVSPTVSSGTSVKFPQALEPNFKAYCLKHNWTPDPSAIEFTPNVEL